MDINYHCAVVGHFRVDILSSLLIFIQGTLQGTNTAKSIDLKLHELARINVVSSVSIHERWIGPIHLPNLRETLATQVE